MSYAVRFSAVTKRYRRGATGRTLRDDVVRWLRRRDRGDARDKGVLAIDDVSFDVEQGDSFALVGPNGAGKTTALKLLTRVLTPTSGEIRVRGRVGALLEVGSGIHPELTGRENIWLYGQMLGMTKAEVRERFDDIVDFSELAHAIDAPVKTFSAGMQVRLGFSIASHIDPDIFVIDEALAVGDSRFQARCVERMRALVEDGRTLIYVSHNLAEVETLCKHGVFLSGGRVQAHGAARDMLASYLDWMAERRSQTRAPLAQHEVQVRDAYCTALDGSRRDVFSPRDGMEVHLSFASGQIERPHVSVGITDGRSGELINCSMLEDGYAPDQVGPGEWHVVLRIDELRLRPRLYEVYCGVLSADGYGTLSDWAAVATFRVEEDRLGGGPAALVGAALRGALQVDYRWHVVNAPVAPPAYDAATVDAASEDTG